MGKEGAVHVEYKGERGFQPVCDCKSEREMRGLKVTESKDSKNMKDLKNHKTKKDPYDFQILKTPKRLSSKKRIREGKLLMTIYTIFCTYFPDFFAFYVKGSNTVR